MKNDSMTKILGAGMIAGAGGLLYLAHQRGVFGLVFAQQGMAGRIAQRREREKARARLFLAQATGTQIAENYANEVVQQESGLAAGKAVEFHKILNRFHQEGRSTNATYNDLGVQQ